MNKDVCVSVVITTYNAENFICECLDATISQTYSNLDIIIVDDNSADSTKRICSEYADKDSRIRLFSLSNNGVSAARNLGIDKAHGEYIVFFDADDKPEITLLEEYIKALEEWENKTVSFVTCGMFYDNMLNKNVDNKISILESYYGYIEGENYLLRKSYAATLAWLKIFNFVTNKIYDLNKIKEYSISFDEKVNIGEDLKFNLDYLEKNHGYIGMVNKPLYHYIKRSDDSLSFTYHVNDIDDTKDIYRRFMNWEACQKGVTLDNILVVKSIFLTDWNSRLSTMYDTFYKNGHARDCLKRINSEINSQEYQTLLNEVYQAKKISRLRYMTLKTRRFQIFLFFRWIYQLMKG